MSCWFLLGPEAVTPPSAPSDRRRRPFESQDALSWGAWSLAAAPNATTAAPSRPVIQTPVRELTQRTDTAGGRTTPLPLFDGPIDPEDYPDSPLGRLYFSPFTKVCSSQQEAAGELGNTSQQRQATQLMPTPG